MIHFARLSSRNYGMYRTRDEKKMHCSEPIGITHCHDKRIGEARNCKSFQGQQQRS